MRMADIDSLDVVDGVARSIPAMTVGIPEAAPRGLDADDDRSWPTNLGGLVVLLVGGGICWLGT